MPKIAKPLNDLQVRRFTRVGWHAVGGVAGLLLQIKPTSGEGITPPRSWILRVRSGGQRQPIGLGSYPLVTLAEAREQGVRMFKQVCGGGYGAGVLPLVTSRRQETGSGRA